jgi:hypothetical protein
MESTDGECNGKMRSTPIPLDTLRTVKVSLTHAFTGDAHAFENLDALFVTFTNAYVYAQRVARRAVLASGQPCTAVVGMTSPFEFNVVPAPRAHLAVFFPNVPCWARLRLPLSGIRSRYAAVGITGALGVFGSAATVRRPVVLVWQTQ